MTSAGAFAKAYSAFAGGFASGFLGSVLGGGDIKSAITAGLLGGLSASFAAEIGHGKEGGAWIEEHGARGLAHGAAQGVVSVMRGGSFKEGFASGSVGHWAGVAARNTFNVESVGGRTAIAAMSGGVASVMGGGKFENGAVTAATVHLFNGESRQKWAEKRMNYDSKSFDDGSHFYRIRGKICSVGTVGCNSDLANKVFETVNSNDIPLTTASGPGNHIIGPFDDPITHHEFVNLKVSVNVTRPGHLFHEGAVTHAVYFSEGNLYYDVIGVGSGSYGPANNLLGNLLFEQGVHSVVNKYGL